MDTGRLRQNLWGYFKELTGLKDKLLIRSPMARGTVYELKRKCGRRNCRCAKGQLHKQMCLAITRKGKKTLRPLKGPELITLQKLTGSHRQFRKARASFTKTSQEIVRLANQLEEEMLKEGEGCLKKEKK